MSRRGSIAGAAAILILTLAAYAPVRQAGFIWDDEDYVTENVNLRTQEGLRRIWFEPGATHQYYPLVHTSFWMEHRLWGLDPLGYHLVNVLLHAANALLLLIVLRRLGVPGALLAAGIFALHPVHVESVAWVTERKNVLAGLFYLLALLAWLRFHPPGDTGKEPQRRWGAYALVLVLFCLALLSKTVTCSLPAVIVLLMWWKQTRLRARDLLPVLPLFALGLGASAVTIWMERQHVGAHGTSWDFSFLERCLIAGRALWFYAGKLVWPQELTFMYPRWTIRTTEAWQFVFPAAAVGFLGVLWAACGRTRKGILVAALFFAGTLLPALGFVNVYPMRYSFVADHFQYLASIGPIALFSAGLTRLLDLCGSGVPRATGRALAALLFLLLAVLTWRQAHIYRDNETLWVDTLKKNPSSWMAHTNLGTLLAHGEDLAGAQEHYQLALLYEPQHVEAHNNLGLLLVRTGKLDEAVGHFEEAVRIDPAYAEAHHNLATARLGQGQPRQAAVHSEMAVRLDPDNADAHFNWAIALVRLGQFDQAAVRLREVLRLRPDDTQARRELAQALGAIGRTQEALEQYRQILGSREDLLAANNLAWILATHPDPALRNGAEAVEVAEHLCRQTGYSEPGVLDTFAAALAEAGRFEEAVRAEGQAIDLSVAAGQQSAVERYRQRQTLYRERTAYRDPAPGISPGKGPG